MIPLFAPAFSGTDTRLACSVLVLPAGRWCFVGRENYLRRTPKLAQSGVGWLTRPRALERPFLAMSADEFPEISLEALGRGDEAAWHEAHPVLFREAWITARGAMLPGFGIDAEDLAQQVITDEVMPGLRRPRQGSFQMIRTFADLVRLTKAITKLRAIDMIRKARRRREDALPEAWENLLGGTDDPADPNHETFWRLVGRLKPPKPELFADHYIGGLGYTEISEQRSMPLGTVCSHMKRGHDVLRRLLENEFAEEERL